jgi:hypothetical protein
MRLVYSLATIEDRIRSQPGIPRHHKNGTELHKIKIRLTKTIIRSSTPGFIYRIYAIAEIDFNAGKKHESGYHIFLPTGQTRKQSSSVLVI